MSRLTRRGRATSLLRHPLVHFVLIGALLFAGWSVLNPADERASRTVAVDAARIGWLADTFEVQFGHRPTARELRSTVEGFVDDELRYRAALDMGLDRDDSVVRRRLIQKYNFLDATDAPLPKDDAELRRFWAANRARYTAPAQVAFCQVYVAAEPARDVALNRTRAIVARLRRGASPDGVGDPIDLPTCFDATATIDIARDLGKFFADTVQKLPVGTWVGPVESGYGFHAVRATARTPSAPLDFVAARDNVLADWRRTRQLADRARRIATLRADYAVRVDDAALAKAAR